MGTVVLADGLPIQSFEATQLLSLIIVELLHFQRLLFAIIDFMSYLLKRRFTCSLF